MIFVINIDDSQCKYEEVFDPSINDFFSPTHFPATIFNLTEFRKPENYGLVLEGVDGCEGMEMHKNFQVLVWSKYKIDD